MKGAHGNEVVDAKYVTGGEAPYYGEHFSQQLWWLLSFAQELYGASKDIVGCQEKVA